ncbi:MAG: lipid A biosynthesis acyltransferase [Planctomycetaceae bacterium]|nr:lipid A biosynthesis acyltransferase [Planctomycetaceae bacterium]
MNWQSFRHAAEYLVFRTLVCVVQALSPRLCLRIANGLGAFVHYVVPHTLTRYDVARTNIKEAFGERYTDGEIDQIIRRMWIHLFRMVIEMIQLPRRLRLDNVVSQVEFQNKPEVVGALCSGRPVILLSGHFGNWEMAISIFGLFGFRMGLVARPLDNPFLDRWFLRFRKYTGHRPIPKNGGSGAMVTLLERGGSLALAGDQDAGSSGLFVNYFGRPASTHKSIGLLAIEYQALICVGYAYRLEHQTLDNGWPKFELGCEEVIDPREFQTQDALQQITQRYTAALERVVRRAPEQYFWVHRRWKSVPRSRAERARRRKAA